MSKQFITKTKNGFDVFVDTEASHAATHLKNHPELFEYLKEILSQYEVKEDGIRFETNLGKEVGKSDLVETKEGDEVFYAKRPNRDKYTRFVRGKDAEPTTFVTIELRKKNETEYDVYTVFIGGTVPTFPTDKNDANEVAREYWKHHALVAGNQTYITETATGECPW